MGLVITAVLDVLAVGFGIFIVFSQPRPVWRDAAEHSRAFWLIWAAIAVMIGLAPAATGLMKDWAAAMWLTVFCALAVLQPAMWGDVLDVRRDVALRRRVLLEKRAREAARVEASRVGWDPIPDNEGSADVPDW
jgi:succinate dehydrogenase hydrophobic anchor subunit